MPNKVTLITPPDLFENSNKSVMVIDLTTKEQDDLSNMLGAYQDDFDINIYFYNGEPEINWLFHAINRAEHVYLSIDKQSEISHLLTSYFLSKPNVWYHTDDENIKALFSHITNRYVTSITEFFEKALHENRHSGL